MANGLTRDATPSNLRAALADQAGGFELLRLPLPREPASPIWPDDTLSRD